MYALVEIKGKQYRAEEGGTLTVDRFTEEPGSKLQLESVLMVSDNGKAEFGAPYLPGAKISVEVGDTFRDKKIRVFKYKKRKNYRRTYGHRESYTRLKVESINT